MSDQIRNQNGKRPLTAKNLNTGTWADEYRDLKHSELGGMVRNLPLNDKMQFLHSVVDAKGGTKVHFGEKVENI